MCDDTFHSSSHHLQPAAVASAPLVPTVSHLVNHYLTRACLSLGHRHSLPLPSLRDVGIRAPATSSATPRPTTTAASADVSIGPQVYQQEVGVRVDISRQTYRQQGGRIHNGAGVSTGGGVSTTGPAYRQQGGCIEHRPGVSTTGRVYRQEADVSTTGRAY